MAEGLLTGAVSILLLVEAIRDTAFLLRTFVGVSKIVKEGPWTIMIISGVSTAGPIGYFTSKYMFPNGINDADILALSVIGLIYLFISILFVLFFLSIDERTVKIALFTLCLCIAFIIGSNTLTPLYLAISTIPLIIAHRKYPNMPKEIKTITLQSSQLIVILLSILIPAFLFFSSRNRGLLFYAVPLITVVASRIFYNQLTNELKSYEL